MTKGIRDFLVYGVFVAGLLVVTRPGSQGGAFVRSLGAAATNFVQGITGQKVSKIA